MFDQSRITPSGEGALPARAGGAALDVGQAPPADQRLGEVGQQLLRMACTHPAHSLRRRADTRSEEHTSELQSRGHLVCRLLLEKKKKTVTALRCWGGVKMRNARSTRI